MAGGNGQMNMKGMGLREQSEQRTRWYGQ